MTRYELEERLIDFAVLVNNVAYSQPFSRGGKYYRDQMIRSSSSCAMNYGETLGAESGKDFIHKNRIVLKELRETFITLRILKKLNINKNEKRLNLALKENNELISIFVKTIKTSQENQKQKK